MRVKDPEKRRAMLLRRIHSSTWGMPDSDGVSDYPRLTVGDLRLLLGIPRTKPPPIPRGKRSGGKP